MRVCVAGCYSSETTVGVFDNMRIGMRVAYSVLKARHTPFAPWTDYLFSLIGGPMSLEEYYSYSLEWLSVCQAVLLVPGWQRSRGTAREIEFANGQGIPVFESLEELLEWAEKQEQERV